MPNTPPWSSDLPWPDHLKPFHPFDVEIQSDPYQHYAWMRDHAPVLRAGERDNPLYIISRFTDVTEGLRDADSFSSMPNQSISVPGFVLTMDPPDHTRLRQAISSAFTPKAVAALEPEIWALVSRHWENFLGAGGGEAMGSFASPLTISVISTVLGVPIDKSEQVRQWTSDIIDYLGTVLRGVPNSGATDRSFREMQDYLSRVLDQASSSEEENVVSNLARLRDEGTITNDEATGFAMTLFMAGHETTTILTGNCLDFLSQNPAQFAALKTSASAAPFLDEMLRYRPPVHRLTRYTHKNVQVADYDIPAGASVRFLIASANRDPRKFDQPETFDPARKNAAHAGFGYGIHMCLGSWLAKLEVRTILENIARTTAELTPAENIGRVPLTGGAFATVGLYSLGIRAKPN